MELRSFSRLDDHAVRSELIAVVSRDRRTTAEMIGLIAVFHARQLYRAAGHDSMYGYCVTELGMSEDVAYKRIRVARTARRHPEVLAALADGRLNLTAVMMLRPYLMEGTASELLQAAAHRSNAGIRQLIAERFPQPDVPTRIEPVAAVVASVSVGASGPKLATGPTGELAARPLGQASVRVLDESMGLLTAPGCDSDVASMAAPTERTRITPLAPERFALQVTLSAGTRDKLRRAQELLGHAVPSGDVAEVLDRALDALIVRLEKRKFAATDRPRAARAAASARTIPAHVRRAVRERDGDRCTYVSADGHRCEARKRLEFDHVVPRAQGGESTVPNLRLRCAAHNQLAAETVLGAGFMAGKRETSRRASAARRNSASALTAAPRARRPIGAPPPETEESRLARIVAMAKLRELLGDEPGAVSERGS